MNEYHYIDKEGVVASVFANKVKIAINGELIFLKNNGRRLQQQDVTFSIISAIAPGQWKEFWKAEKEE